MKHCSWRQAARRLLLSTETCEHIHQLLFCCFSGLLLEVFFFAALGIHVEIKTEILRVSLCTTLEIYKRNVSQNKTETDLSKAQRQGYVVVSWTLASRQRQSIQLITGIDYLCPLIWAKTNIWQTIRTSSGTLQHLHAVTWLMWGSDSETPEAQRISANVTHVNSICRARSCSNRTRYRTCKNEENRK